MDIPVKIDAAVVSDGAWQSEQPMLLNRFLPFSCEIVDVIGVGGAVKLMNAAKLTVSAE